MSAQDFQANSNSSPTLLGSNFTSEEAARLQSLRENFHAHVEYLERVVDERRIEFVRWLIETGKLRESV
jgi:hypothetical protein